MAESPPALLTAQEVADLFRVSKVTVTRWVQDGKLRAIRPGGSTLRFHRSDVEALLEPVEPNEATA